MFKLDFSASYGQFYIADKKTQHNTGADTFWAEDAFHSRLAIGEGILGVGLECYGQVKGELILYSERNDAENYDKYDHVVEGGINVRSGILQILDCPHLNVELEVRVTPGKYRIRIYSSNLASVVGDEGDDYYKIEI